MKLTDHLMFLALMMPTIVLLALAAVSLAQPAHPSTVIHAQVNAVDERGYEGTY